MSLPLSPLAVPVQIPVPTLVPIRHTVAGSGLGVGRCDFGVPDLLAGGKGKFQILFSSSVFSLSSSTSSNAWTKGCFSSVGHLSHISGLWPDTVGNRLDSAVWQSHRVLTGDLISVALLLLVEVVASVSVLNSIAVPVRHQRLAAPLPAVVASLPLLNLMLDLSLPSVALKNVVVVVVVVDLLAPSLPPSPLQAPRPPLRVIGGLH